MDQNLKSEAIDVESIVGNMTLAHELAVNEHFELTPPKDNTFHKHIQDIVHQAFWDHLQEQLSMAPPKYGHALSLLAEIKENLVKLLMPQHNRLKESISNALDLELIQQQVDHDTFDLQKCTDLVVSIMLKICAPARDEKIKSLNGCSDMVALLRGIMEMLDDMKLDMANYQLQSIKPLLIQQGADYERTKFKQFLKANPDGLAATRLWLAAALEAIGGLPDAAGSRRDVTQLSPAVILTHAYLSLLSWSDDAPYPETLVMDEGRLMELSYMFGQLVVVSAVFLVTLNVVGKHLASDTLYVKTLKKNVCILLDGVKTTEYSRAMPGIADQIEQDTTKTLAERDLDPLTPEQTESLRGQILQLTEDDNKIRSLLQSRMRDYVLLSMTQERSSLGKAVPVALKVVQDEIQTLATKFSRLVSHNKDVYLPFYEDIIRELKQRT